MYWIVLIAVEAYISIWSLDSIYDMTKPWQTRLNGAVFYSVLGWLAYWLIGKLFRK